MKLEHQFTVPASVEDTWVAFNDLERVVPCFPGAKLDSTEGDEFTGSCKVKLGPISLQYNGSGKFLERDESARTAVLEAKGKDRRGNGTASAKVSAALSEGSDGTLVNVVTDLNITGKPAQFGRGVMQDVSDKMLAQFVECLQTKLGEPEADTTGPASADPAATGTAPTDAASSDRAPSAEAATGAPGPGADGSPAPTPSAAPGPAAASPSAPGPSAPGPSVPPRTSAPPRSSTSPAPEPEVELDLVRTVAPVLVKRYAPYVLGVVALVVVAWVLGGRRRR